MPEYVPVKGALGYEEISATTTTAIGLTAANINNAGYDGKAIVQVTAYPAATSVHGTAPTSATVKQFSTGDEIKLFGYAEMSQFLAIGIGGTSVLAAQYYQRMP